MVKPVVILCGGFGNRMEIGSNDKPKSMSEIGGKPILWHLLKYFTEYGHNEFIICLGHLKEKIIQYFERFPQPDKIIHLIDTGDGNTSKSQRLLQIKHLIKNDSFLLAYGDDLSNVNLKALLEFHEKNNKMVTITTVNLTSNFGIIKINENDLISDFIEKPVIKDVWINAGFAVLNKDIFGFLKFGELETAVYKLLAEKQNICAFKHNDFWHGINTVKDLNYLNELWEEGNHPWMIWKNE